MNPSTPSPTSSTSERTSTAAPAASAPAALLTRLGWDDAWATSYAELPLDVRRVPGCRLEPARVSRTDKGACDLIAADGAARATWGADVVAAVAHDPTAVPSTGDWVVLATWPDDRRTVEAVLERRTALTRLQVGGSSHAQVIATNTDAVLVVEGLVPDPDRGRIERLMALGWESGATPHLVLTKADMCRDGDELAEELGRTVAPGVTVHVVATPAGEGLEPLHDLLSDGLTVALVGASGVGKSTLLNALVGATAMQTKALGAVNKGRHTTVTRELHLGAAGGCVIDTPGLRSVGLVGDGGLEEVFTDVIELAEQCRFTDCAHEREPGCAVQEAISDGALPERRLESWRKLQREALRQAGRTDARLRQAQLAVWKQRTKEYRARPQKR